MKEWKKYKLDDFIDFNPSITLKKGTLARKITMDRLIPHSRDIYSWEYEEYTGGAKFQNGDTIMARITPCLENGKHAFVSLLEEGETAYGSTEYIVMRGKSGISDNKFVYYLSHYPDFKNAAIKSMVGSSGRQRAQVDVLKNMELILPGLDEQIEIANCLSSLDDKIALNNRINHNLEEQAQALYKSWFIDFEPFKNGKFVDSELGMIPEEWTVSTIGSIASISSGKRPNSKTNYLDKINCFPVLGASSIMAYTEDYLLNEPAIITGRVGTLGLLQRVSQKCWPSDNTLVIKSPYLNFTYQVLKGVDYTSLNRGSTQPLLTQNDLRDWKIILPPLQVIKLYENAVSPLFIMINSMCNQIESLEDIRNTILPLLISGQLPLTC